MPKNRTVPRYKPSNNSLLVAEVSKYIKKFLSQREALVKQDEQSKLTLKAYKNTLNTFMEFLERETDITLTLNDLDEDVINKYLSWSAFYTYNLSLGTLDEVESDLDAFMAFYLDSTADLLTSQMDYCQKLDDSHLSEVISINIEHFCEWVFTTECEGKLRGSSKNYIRNYIEFLSEERHENSASTLKLRRASVGALLSYIDLKTSGAHSLGVSMKLVPRYNSKTKREKKQFEASLLDKVYAMLNDVKPITSKTPNRTEYVDYRDRLLGLFMLLGGLRSHEAIQLKFSDVELVERSGNMFYKVFIEKGKGNKSRTVEIRAELISRHIDFILEHKKDGFTHFSSLKEGKCVAHANLYSKITSLYAKYGIKDPSKKSEFLHGLHVLRHIFASTLARGNNASIVQKALGHSSITTTSIYIAVDNSDLNNAVNGSFGHLKQKG